MLEINTLIALYVAVGCVGSIVIGFIIDRLT